MVTSARRAPPAPVTVSLVVGPVIATGTCGRATTIVSPGVSMVYRPSLVLHSVFDCVMST